MSHPPSLLYAGISAEMLALDEELQSLGGGDTKLEQACLYHLVHPRGSTDDQTIWVRDESLELRDITQPKNAPISQSIKSFPHTGGIISSEDFTTTDVMNEIIEGVCNCINNGFNTCLLNFGSIESKKTSTIWGESNKILSCSSLLFSVLQNLYHYAKIQGQEEISRISVSVFSLLDNDIVDLLTPFNTSKQPLDFVNIYCKDISTSVDILKQAYSRMNKKSHVFIKIMVHRSYDHTQSDEGVLSTLYVIEVADVMSINYSKEFKAFGEKDKILERSRQLEINTLFTMLQDIKQISNTTAHHKPASTITDINQLTDDIYKPVKQLVQARNSKLTTLLAPILQGNMKLVISVYLRDGEQYYHENKHILSHLYSLTDVLSACYRVKNVAWTDLSMMFPEQILPLPPSKPSKLPMQLRSSSNNSTSTVHHSPGHSIVTDYGDIDLEAIASGVFDTSPLSSHNRKVSFLSNSTNQQGDADNSILDGLKGRVSLPTLVDMAERAKGNLQAMAPTQPIESTYLFNKPADQPVKHENMKKSQKGKVEHSDVKKIMEEFHSLVKSLQFKIPSQQETTTNSKQPVNLDRYHNGILSSSLHHSSGRYGQEPTLEDLSQPSPYTNHLREKVIGYDINVDEECKRSSYEHDDYVPSRREGGIISVDRSYKWGGVDHKKDLQFHRSNGTGDVCVEIGRNYMQKSESEHLAYEKSTSSNNASEEEGNSGAHYDSLDDVRKIAEDSAADSHQSSQSESKYDEDYSQDSIEKRDDRSQPASGSSQSTSHAVTMPDYYLPIVVKPDPSTNEDRDSFTLLRDDAIPADIIDLPTALRVIEKLRRNQDSLLQTITNETKAREFWQEKCQALNDDMLELKTEKEVEIDSISYEKKLLFHRIHAALEEKDYDGLFLHLQHDCERLQRENRILQEENLKLELHAIEEYKGLLKKEVDQNSDNLGNGQSSFSLTHYHRQIQELTVKLKKSKQEYHSLKLQFEDMKSKERSYNIQNKLYSTNQLRYKHLFTDAQRLKQQYASLQLQHMELNRQYENLQTYCSEVKESNDRLLGENMSLNKEYNTLQQRYSDLQQERVRAQKMKTFIDKHVSHPHIATFGRNTAKNSSNEENDPPLSHPPSKNSIMSPTTNRPKSYEALYSTKKVVRVSPTTSTPTVNSDMNFAINHIKQQENSASLKETKGTDSLLNALEDNMITHNPALLPLVRQLANEVHVERLKALGEKSKLLDKIKFAKPTKK